MTDEAPVQAPTDIAGVGIHLSYLRRDMSKLNEKLDIITNNYVPITVYLESKGTFEKRIEHLESENDNRKEYQDTLNGKMIVIASLSSVVITFVFFILNHFFK